MDLQVVVDLIPRFVHLESMSLFQVHLPTQFYFDIASLPALTSLSVRSCLMTAVAPRNNRGLPLRQLQLSGVRWLVGHGESRDSITSLACAPFLDLLDVDGFLAPSVLAQMLSYAEQQDMPLVLRCLQTEGRSDEVNDFVPVINFLVKTPSIEKLALRRVPKATALNPNALPNLRAFSGPVHSIETFVQGRPVDYIRILDQLPAVRDPQFALLGVNAHALLGLNATGGSGPQVVPGPGLQPVHYWHGHPSAAQAAGWNVQHGFAGLQNGLVSLLAVQAPVAQPLPPQAQPHHGQLQAIPGTSTGPTWCEIVAVMERVASHTTPLQRLELRVAVYDKEVLFMLHSLFPQIRDLRLTWKSSGARISVDTRASSGPITVQVQAVNVDEDDDGDGDGDGDGFNIDDLLPTRFRPQISQQEPARSAPHPLGSAPSPDDEDVSDFMVEFASEFLCEFPKLEVLYLYGDRSAHRVMTEANHHEYRGLLGLWEKFRPQLCEVALTSDMVWRKWGAKDWAPCRFATSPFISEI